MSEADRIRDALSYLEPDSHDYRVRIAMAVKSELGAAGFDLWDAWFQRTDSYTAKDAKAIWKSVRESGKVRIGTLYRDAKAHGWQDAGARPPLTPEEQAARERAAQAKAAQEAAEEKKRRDKARRKAHAIWNAAQPADDAHSYLIRKRVRAHGLRVGVWPRWQKDGAGRWEEIRTPGALLVPIRSASGTLHSLQAIYAERIEDRDKDYLPDGRKAGCFHLLGDVRADAPLCVAEGYATAASLHEATGWPVAVAFDAGNLEAVARELRARHADVLLIVCADDDHATKGNPGRTKAEAAAAAVGGVLCLPLFAADRPEGWTDFNDLACSERDGEGMAAVQRLLEEARHSFVQANANKPAPAIDNTQAAVVQTPAQDARPAQANAAGDWFEVETDGEAPGVYRVKWQPPKGKDGAPYFDRTFVCAPLAVTHRVRDRNSDCWSRLVEFRNGDWHSRRLIVPDDLLEGDGLALARLLRNRGLDIADNRGGLLKMYVNRERPTARARLTRRIGWHKDVSEAGRWSFVLGGDAEPIAPEGAELWLHDAPGNGGAQFRPAGTLAAWREHVAALAVGNSRLTFALSAGFAAALVWLHPNIAGGFHWAGGSSLGKSALLYAAASLCGAPSYRRTWLLTANAIEATAAGHCDAPLLLDELKQAGNPRDVAQAAYMLTSGQGKGRGQAAGGMRETAEFSLLFQSNGEIGLTQFLEENQERAYAGQEVRFCELPADAGAGFGAWDTLHDHSDGARFSEAVQRNAAKHYGTAWPAFVRRVVDERDGLADEFERMRAQFEKSALSERAGGQAIRAATRFAAVGFAGELATAWGITGWPTGAAAQAAMRIFKDWLQAFGGEENREPRKMIEQAAAFFQLHGVGRFEDWRRPSISDSHAPRTMNRAGWRRPTKETENLKEADQVFEYLVYPAVFKSEVCSGFDPKQVAKVLHDRGMLKRGDGHMTVQAREPGTSKPSRFYCITADVLGGGDDEA
ncbi:DUF927 domain-containing protein [Methyloversatilis discipulorum]|uniref:DUF927 domain-containing protein n=1 Tax=Methyloversatilis discipulorum TaxID=1119528 RepID=UPI003F33FEF9